MRATQFSIDEHPGTDERLYEHHPQPWCGDNQGVRPSCFSQRSPTTQKPWQVARRTFRQRPRLRVPQRELDRRWLDVAKKENAFGRLTVAYPEKNRDSITLKHLLKVAQLTEPIECFDNSNIKGPIRSPPPSSLRMASLINLGIVAMNQNCCRCKDDFGSMAEVLERRLKRAMDESDLPELIVVDGGKRPTQRNKSRSARTTGLGTKPSRTGLDPSVTSWNLKTSYGTCAGESNVPIDWYCDIREPIDTQARIALRLLQAVQIGPSFSRPVPSKTTAQNSADQSFRSNPWPRGCAKKSLVATFRWQ